MWIASKGGHLEIVKQLVSAGAKIDVANRKGETALDVAKRKDRVNVVEFITGRCTQEKRDIRQEREREGGGGGGRLLIIYTAVTNY